MKIYKIFNTKTEQYESFGYNKKSSWLNKPSEHLKYLSEDIYELHIFEAILKEKKHIREKTI